MTEADKRTLAWNEFRARWPLASLSDMTLEAYSQDDPDSCLSGWVKYKLDGLGWRPTGGTGYTRIGVCALPKKYSASAAGDYSNRPSTKVDAQRGYCWMAKLGDSLDEAYARVKQRVIELAQGAAAGNTEVLRATLLCPKYEWKLFCLYQDPLNPVALPGGWPTGLYIAKFKRTVNNRRQSTVDSALLANKALMDVRDGIPLLEYVDQLQTALDRMYEQVDGAQPEADTAETEPILMHPAAMPPLNQILYGPPGTGKTYRTVDAALEILDPACLAAHPGAAGRAARKSRFDELVHEQRVQFVTFHQSFSYEDFVEGLRAKLNDEQQLQYSVEPGVFRRLCDDARPQVTAETQSAEAFTIRPNARVWKISIAGTGHSSTKAYCMANHEARIGWGGTGDLTRDVNSNSYYQSLGKGDHGTLRYFADEIQEGDILLCIHSAYAIAAVGVVTGPYRYQVQEQVPSGVIADYQHIRPVQWLYTDLELPIAPINDGKTFTLKTVYELNRLNWADLQSYLESNACQPVPGSVKQSEAPKPYVLIIDEINRGNISRIFGELITLIEPSKRASAAEALQVLLPYSKKPFSVPPNVHLIGTMNTADRSLASMDVALRRRFVFREVPPQPELLDEVEIEGINLGDLLRVMNQRIEALLGREHCLGHAYFMPLAEDGDLAQLADIFRNQIVPLLQEYFFDDWQRIQWVLNDHRKPEPFRFVRGEVVDVPDLFGVDVNVTRHPQTWSVQASAFGCAPSYMGTIDHRHVGQPA